MKTIIATAGNVLAGLSANEAEPLLEVVLVLSEPKYEADAGGYVKRYALSDFRFGSTPDTLRHVAESLTDLADKADSEFAAFVARCKGEVTT